MELLFYDVLGPELICERSAEADIELRDDWAGPQEEKTIIIQWTPNCLLNGLYSRYIFVRVGHRRIKIIECNTNSLRLMNNLEKDFAAALYLSEAHSPPMFLFWGGQAFFRF
jgi:hypothetical protein